MTSTPTPGPTPGPTAAATLVDRYVAAVLRAIPQTQRADIERELRATLADAIDAKIDAGRDPETAELEALRELGEPMRLAAGYAGRPLHLVGPALYVDYVRLLRLLLAIVLPCVVVGLAIAQGLAGAGIGEIIGAAVATTLAVGVHLCFWITLVFVIIERAGTRTPLLAFDPRQLPDLSATGRGRLPELVASAVFLVLFVGALFWQQSAAIFTDAAGDPIPVLEPELWGFWLPYGIAIAVLELGFAIVLYRVGRWTVPLAAVNIVLNAAFVVPFAWLLATDQVLNPAFFAEFGWEHVVRPGEPGIVIGTLALVGIGLWDSIDGVWDTVRARRRGRG